jgi:serine phosphatase RsbU (regulator of sigma subunit)
VSSSIDSLTATGDVGRSSKLPAKPAPLTVIVLCVGLAITGVLSWVTYSINVHNEGRLLRLQARQAATTLAGAVPSIQTPLASAVEIAGASSGDPAKFDTFMQSFVGSKRPFISASLWRESGGSIVDVATIGSPSDLSQRREQVQSFFTRQLPNGSLAVLGQVDQGQRIGFGFGSLNGTDHYMAYAQAPLPPGHRAVVPQNSAFSDINFALYLGRSVRPSDLMEATGSGMSTSSGQTAIIAVPFGNTYLTIDATPSGQLGGSLLEWLPWIVAVGGSVLSVAAAVVTEILVRRRRTAERLAEANRRLFSQQLTIAETLQHALLPAEFPDFSDFSELDLEAAAKYLPGVRPLDIGGDWYDIVADGPDRLTFVVGDVSGRGLEAATIMASLRFAIRGFATEGYPPDIVLNKLGALLDFKRDGHFATVLCGQIDAQNRRLLLASAGHPPPLLATDDDSRFLQTSVRPPIGVVPGQTYEASTIPLPTHGTLLAFTDGLVERRGESLDLGLERAREAVAGPDRPLDGLLSDIAGSLGADTADDDTAMLALRWTVKELAWRS